jgi:hypothetical protein
VKKGSELITASFHNGKVSAQFSEIYDRSARVCLNGQTPVALPTNLDSQGAVF